MTSASPGQVGAAAPAFDEVPAEPLWKELVALPLAPVRVVWGIGVFALALVGAICFWLCRGQNVAATGFEHFLRGLTGTPMKLAQWAAGRPDLIGADWAKALSGLLDAVRPPPRWVVRWQVRRAARALNLEVAEMMWPPLGAGTVAVVVKVRLADEKLVVFKLARPLYAITARADRWLYLALGWMIHPFMRHVSLPGQLERFSRRVIEQADMRIEARNLRALAFTVTRHPGIRVPEVIGARRNACVMEYIADAHPLGNGADDRRAAVIAVRSLLRALFWGPCMHGDGHRGNLLVAPDGTLWLIDGGLAEFLTTTQRQHLIRGLSGFVSLEPKSLGAAFLAAAPRPPRLSEAKKLAFEEELRVFCNSARARLAAGGCKLTTLVLELFAIQNRFKIGADPHTILANATLALSEPYVELARLDVIVELGSAIASPTYSLDGF